MRYFQVRREAVLRGWGRLFASVILIMAGLLAMAFGAPLMRLALRDTPAPPAIAAVTLAAPTQTGVADAPPPASLTQPATATVINTPGPSATPSQTATPSISPTPVLPVALITPILTATVTPPSQATAADVRFSLQNDCTVPNSQGFFDQTPKQLFAHFFYDSWLPGVQWSGVWLRNGSVIFTETHLWDGSTGGCGYSNFDNHKNWWDAGSYEVQIFVGARWLASNHFLVVRATPSPTPTNTRTALPPTATPTPTILVDTATPSVTPTASDTATPTATASATPTPTTRPPTATASDTPTVTPTRTARPPTATASDTPTVTATIYPPGVTALATIQLPSGVTTYFLRVTAPDGAVVVFVQTGNPVEVLTGYQMIQGVVWRQVRLANGVEGWIQGFMLQITSPN